MTQQRKRKRENNIEKETWEEILEYIYLEIKGELRRKCQKVSTK